MSQDVNGTSSKSMKKRSRAERARQNGSQAGQRRSGSEMVTMEVKLPASEDNQGAGDDNSRIMRIELPRSESANPAAIEAAVAESLRNLDPVVAQQNAVSRDEQRLTRPASPNGKLPGERGTGAGNNDRIGKRRAAPVPEYEEEEFIPDEAPSIGRELSLRDIFFMVRERWILGLSVGLLLAGGLAYWMMSKPPIYQAEAELYVDFSETKVLPIESLEQESGARTTLEQVMEVHAKTLQSPIFRQFVEATLANENGPNSGLDGKEILKDFRSYAAFNKAYTDGLIRKALRGKEATPEALAKLPPPDELFERHFHGRENGALNVSTGKRSQFITVAFRHPDARVARQVTHAFAESYNAFLGARSKERLGDASEFLKAQVTDVEEKIVHQERALQLYRQKYNIVETVEGEGSRASDKLETLDSKLTALQIELDDMELTLDFIKSIDPNDAVQLSQVPVIAEFGVVATIKGKFDLNREERAQLDEKYLARHPKINENTVQRVALEGSLRDNVNMAIGNFSNRVLQKREELAKLKTQLTTAEEATLGDNDPMVEFKVMASGLDILKSRLIALRDSLHDTEISERLDRTRVNINIPALLPQQPVDPDPKKVLALSGLLLLGGLFGLPVGLGFLDTRLKSFSEAESFLGLECLGCVSERTKLSHMELGQCVLAERDEQITEGFRVIYGSVELHSQAGFPKVFVTTSTGPSEGKSFVTANLAATFARHGKRVLIIDADMRKPSQHKLIGARNDAGLLKWYNEGGQVPTTAKELVNDAALGFVPLSEEHDIFLLRAGGSTRNPSEVITSARFEELINALRNWFDVILLDSPPVGLFPDAMFLANYAEEAIFVCKHNGLNRHKIKFALKKIQGGNAHVLGTVMNQLSASRRHQYGYGYKDYGYGSYSYKDYAKYYDDRDDD